MYKFDRRLPERSKLVFYFPNPTEGESKYTLVELPFFENITVDESKSARYVSYKLLSRHSDLYGYTGADSRKFRVSFSINLHHLLSEYPNYINLNIIKNSKSSGLIYNPGNYFGPTQNSNEVEGQAQKAASDHTDYLRTDDTGGIRNVLNHLVNQKDYNSDTADLILNDELSRSSNDSDRKAVEIVLYWVNIVRSSVVTNAKNPILGPPILRLTHGVLYQDIPCIAKSYGFSVGGDSTTYHVDTLLPTDITFSLDLEEFRTGDFDKFEKYTSIKRDNLAGYEAVLFDDNHSMDPGSLK